MGSARIPWFGYGEPVVRQSGEVHCRLRGIPLGSIVRVQAGADDLRLTDLWLAYLPGQTEEGEPFRLRREAARWLLERSLRVTP